MIGILGGTFNPIHYGHLRLALSVFEQLQLTRVHLVLSARPPHRDEPQVSIEQRWQMLCMALADEPALLADDSEIQRQGSSYMVDTLAHLRQKTGQSLVLILGSDALNGLLTWHQWPRLFDWCHVVVVKRPQQPLNLKPQLSAYLTPKKAPSPHILAQHAAGFYHELEMSPQPFAISASMIRALLHNQRNPRYLLPDAVLAWIYSHGLYT